MNARKIIGGILAGALLLTSVPLANVGGIIAVAETTAEDELTNVLRDKTVELTKSSQSYASNDANAIGVNKYYGGNLSDEEHLKRVTDGIIPGTDGNYLELFKGAMLKIDLGEVKQDLRTIKIYLRSGRTFWDNVIVLGDENNNETVVFNNCESDLYGFSAGNGGRITGSADGYTINLPEGTSARYLKFYSGTNNQTQKPQSQIGEIEMYAGNKVNPPANSVTINATGTNGTVSVTDSDGTECNGVGVAYGTKVKLKATPNNGFDFSYWLDTDTNKVVSNATELEMVALSTRNLTAVFAETGSSAYTVTFKLPALFANKVVVKKQAVNGEVTAPEAGAVSGYDFEGWKSEGWKNDNNEAVCASGSLIKVTENRTFEAVYTPKLEKLYCLLGAGLKFDTGNTYRNDCKRDEVITVEAPPVMNGQKFAGWYVSYDFVNFDTLISTNTKLSWVMKGNVSLKPAYADSPAEPAPTVAFGISERKKLTDGSGKQAIRVQVVYDSIADARVIEKGVLMTWDENSKDNLNLDVSDPNVRRFYSEGSWQSGSYILNATLGATTSTSRTVFCRGYLTYEASDGTLNTIYTDSVKELAVVE